MNLTTSTTKQLLYVLISYCWLVKMDFSRYFTFLSFPFSFSFCLARLTNESSLLPSSMVHSSLLLDVNSLMIVLLPYTSGVPSSSQRMMHAEQLNPRESFLLGTTLELDRNPRRALASATRSAVEWISRHAKDLNACSEGERISMPAMASGKRSEAEVITWLALDSGEIGGGGDLSAEQNLANAYSSSRRAFLEHFRQACSQLIEGGWPYPRRRGHWAANPSTEAGAVQRIEQDAGAGQRIEQGRGSQVRDGGDVGGTDWLLMGCPRLG